MKNAVAVFLAIVFVAACAGAGIWGTERLIAVVSPAEEDRESGPSATRVTVASPQAERILDAFGALATIRATREIELTPLTDGRVEEIAVASGDRVEAGELILALDARAERASLAEARATLAEARSANSRYEALATEDVAADARLEEARAAFERARAQVALAEAAFEDTRVRAPFDGVLGIIDIDPGERVDPSTALTTLDHVATVQAAFAVPERYYNRAEVGQTVLLDGDVYENRVFEGEVTAKSPRIDSASRSFEVRVEVDNEDGALTPGMFMNATLVFRSYEAPTLPDDAIISEGSTTYVYTVEDGAARRTAISVGARREGRTEITDGLSDEARVVTTGYDQISDGDPVEVADDAAADEALN